MGSAGTLTFVIVQIVTDKWAERQYNFQEAAGVSLRHNFLMGCGGGGGNDNQPLNA
jgi:hypothetical protein